jgi:hypothetical protein
VLSAHEGARVGALAIYWRVLSGRRYAKSVLDIAYWASPGVVIGPPERGVIPRSDESIEEVRDVAARPGVQAEGERREGQLLWAYRYRLEGRGSGRPQVGGFATRAEALKALEKVLARLGPGERAATMTRDVDRELGVAYVCRGTRAGGSSTQRRV